MYVCSVFITLVDVEKESFAHLDVLNLKVMKTGKKSLAEIHINRIHCLVRC